MTDYRSRGKVHGNRSGKTKVSRGKSESIPRSMMVTEKGKASMGGAKKIKSGDKASSGKINRGK